VWMVDCERPMRRDMEGPQMSTSMMPVCHDQNDV
jgi:hypothetical protein